VVSEKGVPRKDGSGGGIRKNRGRGGCETTREVGQGRMTPPPGRGRGSGRGRGGGRGYGRRGRFWD